MAAGASACVCVASEDQGLVSSWKCFRKVDKNANVDFKTFSLVFQLCVHHGELRLSQLALKSRAASAVVRMGGGSNEPLVTTIAQVSCNYCENTL